MNADLTRPFSSDEVQQTLDQMHPPKSPGPDGMSPIFFPKFWHIVVYKLASKAIVNRLKLLLGSNISESQLAFVPSRLIIDNVMVAHEFNQFPAHKYWGSSQQISLKLNISTTYDQVEWIFLERVLTRLGFHAKFVTLIMHCVSSVSFLFLLNGVIFGSLKSKSGLRQGDPLSPYLFSLCAEDFSNLIQQEERCGNLQGVSICRNDPKISHFLFAGDTLIFCQATREVVQCVRTILHLLEATSGLRMNMSKLAVVFSKNTPLLVRTELLAGLGVPMVLKHDKYLGFPSVFGHSKRAVFDSIKDHIWRKINSWSAKKLSQASRMVMFKSVL
ncbi:UNVERIFIED_CONTAM: putative mitochondrial protein [Sesamum latifolium]|uniref:Mitochondrial protein n=1 Tax=Sesamum latifolium TaxID=2727402 RepID=A0AAW2WIZ8_9LAMI